MRKTFLILFFTALCATALHGQATLFEYPEAPDTCTTFGSRCDYSVQHFWDKCDLTKPFKHENDSLLLTALSDYINIMAAGADLRVSVASIRSLMNKAQANHPNFMRLASMAEFMLYMRPVDVVDDIYLAFAQSVVDATWLDKEKEGKQVRQHFKEQVDCIKASKLNDVITDFEYTGLDGRKHRLSESSGSDLIFILVDGGDSASAIARTRLSCDVTISSAVKNGSLKVLAITAAPPAKWDAEWQNLVNEGWTVGAWKGIAKVLDVRMMPCVIVLDKDLRVRAKNLSIDRVKAMLGN